MDLDVLREDLRDALARPNHPSHITIRHVELELVLDRLDEMTTTGAALDLIAAERQRQVAAEGWTSEHDMAHMRGELAIAAACYALPEYLRGDVLAHWPWHENWWKPSPRDRVRELVKAGALIAAEIDRVRAETEAP